MRIMRGGRNWGFGALVGALVVGCGGDGEVSSPPGRDTALPSFAGLTGAEAVGEIAARLTWAPATDDRSSAAELSYTVYGAVGTAPIDFTQPLVRTAAGAAGVTVSGLRSGAEHRFVVRAIDRAGNEEKNEVASQVTLADTTPPVFGGITGVRAAPGRALFAVWKPATDAGAAGFELKYRVYVATTPTGHDFTTPNATTGAGATRATVTGAPSGGDVYVVVRAVDPAGNEDQNTRALSTTVDVGTPPTFLGAASARAAGTTIELSWAPATDDQSASSAIVYRIYQATRSGGQNFAAPTLESARGATSITLSNLAPQTPYFFVVRAVDELGNEDSNGVEVSATTGGADTTAPTFAGATSVVGESPSTLRVNWAAATDDATSAERIMYEVFVGDSAGVATTTPFRSVSGGATSVLIAGLPAGATRFVVVRARDASNNLSGTGTERSGATLAATSDATPPAFTGSLQLTRVAATPDRLLVSWPPATDAGSTADKLRYLVCAAEDAAGCDGDAFTRNVNAVSDAGQNAAFAVGLDSRTSYRVVVRALDEGGNLSTAQLAATGTTATSFQNDVGPLLRTRCGACHSYRYGTLVNVASTYTPSGATAALPLVAPGAPENSYVLRKLRPDADATAPFSAAAPNAFSQARMPSDGTAFFDADTEAPLIEWIRQGAFNQ